MQQQSSSSPSSPLLDLPSDLPRVEIFPRKKQGQKSLSKRQGVSLTLTDVQGMFHLRQSEAAKLLVSASSTLLYLLATNLTRFSSQGISLTAMKCACRRMGVTRWPYSRHRQSPVTMQDQHHAAGASTEVPATPGWQEGDACGDHLSSASSPHAGADSDDMSDMETICYAGEGASPSSPSMLQDTAQWSSEGMEPEEEPLEREWIEWYMKTPDVGSEETLTMS
ncbi:hypothetical protein GUITHDRAFT_111374 [Guillardia theta CCMP2712]|uniref:RWP-RK domain-containing protein n=1 Tax=Guillardia theta (strain CCMP2712) TaxID=905079 RepID=L1J316_GUITC|nr:hypothetical protein GUITHDRAFT_111374 [Guillardia theta CCMP2712]EKX42702.1 hypothetical protein GUITHDRAFT_111374 [Guillardia theta CCMP2712]|eukprot:XP_005829682.1 hypothetical protein GUITHDRAFT_111374 [Guillardia theta CCMP2712]